MQFEDPQFVAVIMAGGSGTRFWPLSRRKTPKQLLSINDNPTMLETTFNRLRKLVPAENILVVTSQNQSSSVRETVPELPESNVIAEPTPRDTAACVGVSATLVNHRVGSNTVLGIFPSDHHIEPEEAFQENVRDAYHACDELRQIITFGIEPDHPSTGYGYIRFNREEEKEVTGSTVYKVDEFTEKPDEERAQDLVNQGALWNSGMFFWTSQHILDQIGRHIPDLRTQLDEISDDLEKGINLQESLNNHYPQMPETSIDYGVLERTSSCWTLPVQFNWNDLGTLVELQKFINEDERGNLKLGDSVAIDTHNSIIVNQDDRLIATLGVDDLIVIATDDAILVCPKERSEDVKTIVEHLEEHQRDDLL